VPTLEEQAIAAIDMAEEMAVANVQLIRKMKMLFPKSVRPLIGAAPDLAERQFGLVADVERAVVRKVSRKKTDYDRRMSRALAEVNKTARLKNGSFRKGWDQAKVMKKAHKLARKYGPSTKKGQVRKTARRAYARR
jgi:hypothetical protein